jgi:predicted permease
MESFIQDMRYGLRQLLKNRGFALTAVVSLALGIGATSTVFSVIYAVLLHPYPYAGVDRIMRLKLQSKAGSSVVDLTGLQIRQLQRHPVVESVLAIDYNDCILTGQDVPVDVYAIDLISTGFADLGVPPLLGRGLVPSDAIDGQEPHPVVVLSYKFWQRQYSSDPGVVGKALELDHRSYTIVGVAAPRFAWYSADLYRPLKLTVDPGLMYLVNVRLRPGVNKSAADAALQPLLDQFARDMPKHYPHHFQVRLEGLTEWLARDLSRILCLLFGAVALLLAIGCANVSILLLARGSARQHELAVRVAIGVGRRRIVRQLLTESMLLAVLGVALGVWISYGILSGFRVLLYGFAPEVAININLPVLIFSGAVALATVFLFGLWPALQLSQAQASQMIQSNARRVAGTVHGRRTHQALIAGQIALTLLLLAGAGSAMGGFLRLTHTSLGYDPHNVLALGIPLRDNSYTTWLARATYFDKLKTKVAEAPGVTMTAIANNAVPPRSGSTMRFEILGKPAAEEQMGSINLIGPEYFQVLRIPLLGGRIWSANENHNGAHVAVVNRALARRYFPSGDAIGRSIKLPGLEDRPPQILAAPGIADSWLQIVGVVEDARNDGLSNSVKPAVFVPYALSMGPSTHILVRAQVPPLTLLHSLRRQLAAVNPDQQSYNRVEDLASWISDETEWQQAHLAAWVFGIFVGLALILAAVGLYSVVTYTVARRTHEFGIRLALGARSGHVIRIVFTSTLVSVASGVSAGVVLTLALNRILAQWTQGNSLHPLILLAGITLLGAVAGFACAVPAWRACRTDPMTALRCE